MSTCALAGTVGTACLPSRSPAVDSGLPPVRKAQWTLVTHPPHPDASVWCNTDAAKMCVLGVIPLLL